MAIGDHATARTAGLKRSLTHPGSCTAPNAPSKNTSGSPIVVVRGPRLALRRSNGRRRGARPRSRTRGRRGVSEQGCAAASGFPVEAGEPLRAGGVARIANSCWLPSTLTPKRPARRMQDQVSEPREGQNAIRGGSSETEVSELTISPAGSPSGAAVTNATPVANLPSASRKERPSALVRPGCSRERHLSGATSLRRERRGRGSRTRGWRRAGA